MLGRARQIPWDRRPSRNNLERQAALVLGQSAVAVDADRNNRHQRPPNSLELRLAFFQERRHALALIVSTEQTLKNAALVMDALCE